MRATKITAKHFIKLCSQTTNTKHFCSTERPPCTIYRYCLDFLSLASRSCTCLIWKAPSILIYTPSRYKFHHFFLLFFLFFFGFVFFSILSFFFLCKSLNILMIIYCYTRLYPPTLLFCSRLAQRLNIWELRYNHSQRPPRAALSLAPSRIGPWSIIYSTAATKTDCPIC